MKHRRSTITARKSVLQGRGFTFWVWIRVWENFMQGKLPLILPVFFITKVQVWFIYSYVPKMQEFEHTYEWFPTAVCCIFYWSVLHYSDCKRVYITWIMRMASCPLQNLCLHFNVILFLCENSQRQRKKFILPKPKRYNSLHWGFQKDHESRK
jgi:hypothetical protein